MAPATELSIRGLPRPFGACPLARESFPEENGMAEGNVAERVIGVFAKFKKVDPSQINLDTTFEELGLDSLDGLDLIFELEEEFDISIPDSQVQQMRSVRQAVEGVEMLLDAKAKGIDPVAIAAEEFARMQQEFRARKAFGAAAPQAESPAEQN
jgi:acyl carrier protein